MQYVLPTRLLPLNRVPLGPRPVAHLGCIVGFRFDAPRKPLGIVDLAAVMAESPDGQAIDIGFAKPHAEVLVAGAAQAPGGTPVPGLDVSVALGAFRKTVRVFGDRWWQWRGADGGWVPTDPKPFTEQPLSWAHAYGGPDVAENPLGRGADAMARLRAGELAQLPNQEHPGQLITDPDRPAPVVHLGATDPGWPLRTRKLGTKYDQAWRESGWPGMAEDFNPEFYNGAPPDQWMERPFNGDEPFEIHHMHADHPVQRGRLPGLRARCFLAAPEGPDAPPGRDRLDEVPLHLETVWLLGTKRIGLMIYRGTRRVRDMEISTHRGMLLALEWMADAPKPPEHYAEAYRLRTDPETAYLHVGNDAPLMPPLDAAELEAVETAQAAANAAFRAAYDKRKAALRAKLAVPALSAQLAAGGLDMATVAEGDARIAEQTAALGQPRIPSVAGDGIAGAKPVDTTSILDGPAFQAIEAALDAIPIPTAEAIAQGRLDVAGLVAGMDALDKAVDAATASLGGGGGGLAGADAAAAALKGPDLSNIRQVMQTSMPADGRDQVDQALADLDTALAETEGAPALDPAPEETEARQRAAVYHRVFGPAPTSASAGDTAEAPLSPEALLDQDLSKPPGGSPLPDFDTLLDRLGLADGPPQPGADLHERHAKIEAGAKDILAETLPDADAPMPVSGPLLPPVRRYLGTLIAEAIGRGHPLAGRDLSEADAAGLDFRGTDLTGVTLRGADLSGAHLSGCRLDGAALDDAQLTGADLAGCSLREASFRGTRLFRARLTGADLSEALLYQVTSAPPPGAQDPGAAPDAAPGADTATIDLSGATLTGTILMGCTLPRSLWRGATLSGVTLQDCDLTGADFGEATLDSTVVLECPAETIRFVDATLTKCDLIRCRMPRAAMARVTMGETNWFETDLTEATAPEATFTKVALATVAADGLVLTGSTLEAVTIVLNSTLRQARLDRCLARRLSMRGAVATGADLSRSDLREADLSESDLTGATLARAALQTATLSKTVLRGARLPGAALFQALMRGADCRDADFTGAILYEAQPIEADFTGAVLDGADLTGFKRPKPPERGPDDAR